MAGKGVQAAIVHIGQHLGCGFAQGLAIGRCQLDLPGLLGPRPEQVAEGRELHLELAIVPGHEHPGAELHQLVVAHHGQGQTKTTSFGFGDRKLDQVCAFASRQCTALDELALAIDVQKQRLIFQTRQGHDPGRVAHLDRGLLQPQHGRQGQFGAFARHDDHLGHLVFGAEGVLGLVFDPVGPGRKLGERKLGFALGVVFQIALGFAGPIGPGAHDRFGLISRAPTRPELIVFGPVGLARVRRRRQGDGLVGRQTGPGRRLHGDHPVFALSSHGRPVQIGAHDLYLGRHPFAHKLHIRIHVRGHGHEAEPEGARGRAGLATLVDHLGRDRIRVTDVFAFALVGLGRKYNLEAAVVFELAHPGGDHLALGAAATAVVVRVPIGVDRRAIDLPAHRAVGHRQAEVVLGLARKLGLPVQAQGLVGIDHFSFEGGPLVLLDFDVALTIDRALQPPLTQQPPGGDNEGARCAAELVGGHRFLSHLLVVGIHQRDGDLCIGHGLVIRFVAPAPVDHGLEVQGLGGSIDAAIGKQHGGTVRIRGAVAVQVLVGGIQRSLVAFLCKQEIRTAPARTEVHPTVSTRGLALHHPVALFPVVLIEHHIGAADRLTASARIDGRVQTAALGATGDHQVGDDQPGAVDHVVARFEILAGRGHHRIQTGFCHGRKYMLAVLLEVGRSAQRHLPLVIGRALVHQLLDLALVRKDAVVVGRFDLILQVQPIGPQVQGV